MPSKSYINNSADIKINTHDEVDQILGRPPGWMLRRGISVIFLTVIIFIAMSWFIKYPDKIPAQVTISTENPSIKVVARLSGKIDKLFVNNNQKIKEGEIIALFDDPASLDDINELSAFLKDLKPTQDIKPTLDYLRTETKVLPHDLKLGSIQNSYAAFSQKVDDYIYFQNRKDTPRKIQSLKAQIVHKERLGTNFEKQKTILLQEVSLTEKDLQRNEDLNKEGIVSDINLEKNETQVLQQKRQLQSLENQLINNDISIEEIRTKLIDLRQGHKDGFSIRQLNIKEDIERLKSDITFWKQNYLIIAPISGVASFSNIWSEQQFINKSEEILTIVPSEGAGRVIARALLPIHNSGKVEPGQIVNIRLNGFPYQEYGIIKGSIDQISLVPLASSFQKEENYLLHIRLPDTLRTTYNKVIPFRQKMNGTANIITEDRRIITRIFDRMNNLIKSN